MTTVHLDAVPRLERSAIICIDRGAIAVRQARHFKSTFRTIGHGLREKQSGNSELLGQFVCITYFRLLYPQGHPSEIDHSGVGSSIERSIGSQGFPMKWKPVGSRYRYVYARSGVL